MSSTTFTYAFGVAALSGNRVITFPDADGIANQYLSNDGSGNLSWVSPTVVSPNGLTGSVQYNNAGSFGGDAPNFFWDATNKRLGIGTNAPSAKLNILTVSATEVGQLIKGTAAQSVDLLQVQSSTGAALATINNIGDLSTIKSVAYSWPAAHGVAKSFLQTTAAGALSWSVDGSALTGVSAAYTNITGMTLGSVPFAGASGMLQDNANLFWDDTNNRLGIGLNNPSAQLHLSGTSVATPKLNMTGVITVPTSSGFSMVSKQVQFDLQSATTVGEVYADLSISTINSTLNNPDITFVQTYAGRIDTAAAYTGTISIGRIFFALNPTLLGSKPITTFYQFAGDPITNGNGITSGTINNYGMFIGSHTAAAASGGIVVNHGILANVPSGSGAGTTVNYGIRIIGNGGSTASGTTNWAIHSASTAMSYIAGKLGIGTTTPVTKLHIQADVGVTSGQYLSNSDFVSGATGTALFMGTGTASGVTYCSVYGSVNGGTGWGKLYLGGGNVGINNSDPGYQFEVDYSGASYTTKLNNTLGTQFGHGLLIQGGSNATPGALMAAFIRPDGTGIGTISQNSATTVAYNTSSDFRIKENIIDSIRGLEVLNRITVRDFNYIYDPNKAKLQGFIAQELNEVYPEAVSPGGDDARENPWSVEYGRLTPLLVKSVQELSAENETLKSTIDLLIERISALEEK
jgi:hypothetical protein